MGKEEERHIMIVFGWLLGLAIGWKELRTAQGPELLKLCVAFWLCGALCAAIGLAIITTSRVKSGKARVWQEALFLLGLTAIVLLYGK